MNGDADGWRRQLLIEIIRFAERSSEVSAAIKLVTADANLAQAGSRRAACAARSSRPRRSRRWRRPATSQPDVLIVDLRGHSGISVGAARCKRRNHPATGVLLVVTTLDPALMLEAMRAGVNECVTEPVSRRRAAGGDQAAGRQSRRPRRRATSSPSSAPRAASARPRVAVNVATALAEADPGSTLLIDLHVACGDAAVFLGAEPRFSVADALENIHRLDERSSRA